jgi:Tfp pilus assembly protein PilX
MVTSLSRPAFHQRRSRQSGVATLVVVLVVLVILTIIVLTSSSVAMFEQKTATNENRSRLAEQAAEYALAMGGEYFKANVTKISTTNPGGWLDTATASNKRWRPCAAVTDTTHPCFAEPNAQTRAQMYYFTSDGTVATSGASPKLDVPYNNLVPDTIKMETANVGVGGASHFPASAKVKALLCRVDTSLTPARCQLSPLGGRQIAVTLIAESSLSGERAKAVVKETWASLPKTSYSSSAPLVASGFIDFVGTYTVVAAPDAGGPGVNTSAWSPKDIGGMGSWQTCDRDDYLGGLNKRYLSTNPGCAEGKTCACDTDINSTKGKEGEDIVDAGDGNKPLPDITFFPGSNSAGVRLDDPADFTDDNLFEWIFGVDVTDGNGNVVQMNCPNTLGGANDDCERKAMQDLGFEVTTNCSELGETASGLYYFVGAPTACDPPKNASNDVVVGGPNSQVILVVDEEYTAGHTDLFYGMVFVRSPTNSAAIKGNAKGMHFGSIVVEGDGKLNGNMDLIYMDTSAGSPNDPLPESTRFARLPGSWLDNKTGF